MSELKPCPWCGNTVDNRISCATAVAVAYCGKCGSGVTGPNVASEQSAADAWIELSEKVHGKQHDGPTVDVHIAVAVDGGGVWGVEALFGGSREEAFEEAGKWLFGQRSYHVITATIPVPVAQEIKGRVEG